MTAELIAGAELGTAAYYFAAGQAHEGETFEAMQERMQLACDFSWYARNYAYEQDDDETGEDLCYPMDLSLVWRAFLESKASQREVLDGFISK